MDDPKRIQTVALGELLGHSPTLSAPGILLLFSGRASLRFRSCRKGWKQSTGCRILPDRLIERRSGFHKLHYAHEGDQSFLTVTGLAQRPQRHILYSECGGVVLPGWALVSLGPSRPILDTSDVPGRPITDNRCVCQKTNDLTPNVNLLS